VDTARVEIDAWYRRYNPCCNEHRFDDLNEFVADDVVVNGAVHGLTSYKAGLQAVVDAFPDYRWSRSGRAGLGRCLVTWLCCASAGSAGSGAVVEPGAFDVGAAQRWQQGQQISGGTAHPAGLFAGCVDDPDLDRSTTAATGCVSRTSSPVYPTGFEPDGCPWLTIADGDAQLSVPH
jgi:hypothetical protein